MSDVSKPKDKTKVWRYALGFLIIITVSIAVVQNLIRKLNRSYETENVKASDITDSQAWTIAQGFVERFLKAPGTADFPLQAERVKRTDDTFDVLGYVDAQNAFGAQLRTPIICKMTYLGGDWAEPASWRPRLILLGDDVVLDEVGFSDNLKQP